MAWEMQFMFLIVCGGFGVCLFAYVEFLQGASLRVLFM